LAQRLRRAHTGGVRPTGSDGSDGTRTATSGVTGCRTPIQKTCK
jgi:hypothetical protein